MVCLRNSVEMNFHSFHVKIITKRTKKIQDENKMRNNNDKEKESNAYNK